MSLFICATADTLPLEDFENSGNDSLDPSNEPQNDQQQQEESQNLRQEDNRQQEPLIVRWRTPFLIRDDMIRNTTLKLLNKKMFPKQSERSDILSGINEECTKIT